MVCPRCSVAEISADTSECQLCGYSPGRAKEVAVLVPDELDELVQQELGGVFRVGRELRRVEGRRAYVAVDGGGRPVTLTIALRPPGRDSTVAQRFKQAMAIAADLDHPHAVPVYESGATRSLLWYAGKYMNARTLAEMAAETDPMDPLTMRKIVEQVGSALDYAHRRGVSHGAVRAEAVLVDAAGWAYLADSCVDQALRGEGQAGPRDDQRDLATMVSACLKMSTEGSNVPPHFVRAVDRAMEEGSVKGFHTVLDFVAALSRASPAAVAPVLPASTRRSGSLLMVPPRTDQAAVRRRRVWWMAGAAALPVAVIGFAVFWRRLPPAAPSVWVDAPAVVLSRPVAPVAPVATPAPAPPATISRPAPPVATRIPAAPRAAPAPLAPGLLFVNSTPWGQVYIDGELVGNTPRSNIPVAPGFHDLRIFRQGFMPLERRIQVAEGQELRLTDLVLVRP